jgi:RimJ/RimL family protein N-acetyltransferase
MSVLLFRPSTIKDMPFYESVLRDSEWIDNSGFRKKDFSTEEQLTKFITNQCKEDFKGVVVNERNEYISFCHFKYLGDKKYEICGGVRKDLLDKGFGIISIVFCVDQLFKNRECEEIQSVILESNTRSRRMNTSVGFSEIGVQYYDVRKFIVHTLTPEVFYDNRFARHIAKRFL